MIVSDLKSVLESPQTERDVDISLGDLSLSEDASHITVQSTEEEFAFDELAERALAAYLGINKSYLAKCPPDLKALNVNHWLRTKDETRGIIQAVGPNIVNVHKPGLIILPLPRVAEIVTRVFDPSHEIVNLIRDERKFHIDIKTPHHVEVRPDTRIEGRREVGDITHGGVRLLSNPMVVEAPRVQTFLHRLWCTNGCVSPEREGTIRIKGNTVDEVLAEMEAACQTVMGDLDNKLAAYAALADRRPPGSPSRFAYQLGHEYNLRNRVMDRVMERVGILPEDATLYDVMQIFTQLANGAVSYDTMMTLQGLGGDLAFLTDQLIHRCDTCQRLLPEL